ncbi:hypothetical protein SAMN04515671_1279 [Nakamurella panacisegetis]|uniref:Uncharacterized protein n=1 Tax=Nakamurella panacisegetis TaxID=1090615 RepID=A0A1H0KF28_9ACTN|nr:hypothetical protein [Nakamurella panacisegetis]SDO54446.1 hypothetical protein SAMN04515671_1279 [Nakamurella panacisegetis]
MLIFDGVIAGVGTTSGTRLVVGLWPSSPLGPIADVMVERPDGRRTLLAPSAEVADFIAGTYRFDEISVVPVSYTRDGARWSIAAGPLRLVITTGSRGVLGRLLSVVPRPLARARWWSALLDPIAALVMPGVRTRGTAGGGRREWYAALDLHRIATVDATWDGVDLGSLADVEPPVRFGFGSTPARPSLVRVTTTIDLGVTGA